MTARGMFGMLLEHSNNQRLCSAQPSFRIVKGSRPFRLRAKSACIRACVVCRIFCGSRDAISKVCGRSTEILVDLPNFTMRRTVKCDIWLEKLEKRIDFKNFYTNQTSVCHSKSSNIEIYIHEYVKLNRKSTDFVTCIALYATLCY